jgi:hypothetical protein
MRAWYSSGQMRVIPARAFLFVFGVNRTLWAQIAASNAAVLPPPPAAAADDATPIEVSVHGTKQTADVGAIEIPAKALRDIPGTFGDPFQTIASLPGVLPMASGLPYFYVRGAPPANTGYFLDGIPLPTLFHIGPGPSVVPPALLDRVDFFPGSAPARFGRFSGGIISGEMAAPSDVARGEASVRWFDASAFLEVPLDDKSTALVAGRYGYPNLLLSIFAPGLHLSYDDYTVRLTRKLTDSDAISFLALGSYDSESGLVPVDSLFHRLDLRYDHALPGGSIRLATTFGYDRTTAPLITQFSEVVTETSVRLRFELKERLGSILVMTAGADGNALLDRQGNAALNAEQVGGAYADVTCRPTDRVEVVAGARMDAYRFLGTVTPSLDPRLALRVRVVQGVSSVTTLGVAHQPPSSLLPAPGLVLNPADGLQTAYQYADGAELRLPWALTASITGFYNADHNMNDFVQDCGSFTTICGLVARTDGSSYGLELHLQRAFSQRFAGWISYTLSRTERHIGAVPFLSPFDRTHVLSAVVRYDFGRGIEAGVRATFNSGRPDIPSFTLNDATLPLALGAASIPQHRLPDFYRIDVRAEKRWTFGARKWLALVLEFFDATLNSEAVDFQCSINQGVCTAQKVGPLALPSIGVEAGF